MTEKGKRNVRKISSIDMCIQNIIPLTLIDYETQNAYLSNLLGQKVTGGRIGAVLPTRLVSVSAESRELIFELEYPEGPYILKKGSTWRPSYKIRVNGTERCCHSMEEVTLVYDASIFNSPMFWKKVEAYRFCTQTANRICLRSELIEELPGKCRAC